MISTSRISGTSLRVVRPGASRAAAMSLRTLFFAPVTATSPLSRLPPTTRRASTGIMLGVARRAPPPPRGAPRSPLGS